MSSAARPGSTARPQHNLCIGPGTVGTTNRSAPSYHNAAVMPRKAFTAFLHDAVGSCTHAWQCPLLGVFGTLGSRGLVLHAHQHHPTRTHTPTQAHHTHTSTQPPTRTHTTPQKHTHRAPAQAHHSRAVKARGHPTLTRKVSGRAVSCQLKGAAVFAQLHTQRDLPRRKMPEEGLRITHDSHPSPLT